MSESYVEAKVVLENAKSSTWIFFKFRVAAGEVDRSYVHCKLCLDDGQRKKGLIVCMFVCQRNIYLLRSDQVHVLNFLVLFMISGLLKKITYFANLRRVKINRRLIGAVFY